MNKETDALYILSALPHVVDCVMADLERRRYRKYFLVWTSSMEMEILLEAFDRLLMQYLS